MMPLAPKNAARDMRVLHVARLIDTAQIYGNHEDIAEAIRCKPRVERCERFALVSSKEPESTRPAIS